MASFLEQDDKIEAVLSTPEGPNKLIVERAHILERLSDLFTITVEVQSKSKSLDFTSLMGKPAQLKLSWGQGKERFFSGVIAHIRQGRTVDETGFTHYTLTLRPTYWMATHNQDYKIFQKKSAQDIVQDVLKENQVSKIQMKASSHGTAPRKYCVRYGESAYAFTARLLSEEGMFYAFHHTSSGDELMICDDVGSLESIQPSSLEFFPQAVGEPFGNKVKEFYLEQQVVPKQSALADYDFIAPSTKLYPKTSGEGEGGDVYTFPGRFFKMATGEKLNKVQIERLEWAKKLYHGRSTSPTMVPGWKFTLKNHPREDANDTYNLYEVEHFLDLRPDGGHVYENRFVCFPSTTPFRPDLLPKPRIYSNQVAIVTGPSGEEIHTDEHGRIKVQFYWDQYGTNDDKSSCWVRVSQAWSGKNWGFMFIPRIGMEVIVTFIEGDPDRPMVVGCVYNGENAPPYPLPAEKTKSTIKTNSSKNAMDAFNELRFEDKKDQEQVYMRAQKDWDREIMKGNRTLLIHEGNDTKTISKGNYLLTHQAEGPPPTHIIHMVKGNQFTNLDQGNKTINLKQGNMATNLALGNYAVGANGNVVITATDTITLAAPNIVIAAGASLVLSSGGGILMDAGSDNSGSAASAGQGTDAASPPPPSPVKSDPLNLKIVSKGMMDVSITQTIQMTTPASMTFTTGSTIQMAGGGGGMIFTPGSANSIVMGAQGLVQASGQITLDGGGATSIKGGQISLG